jgi:hypothetical protein
MQEKDKIQPDNIDWATKERERILGILRGITRDQIRLSMGELSDQEIRSIFAAISLIVFLIEDRLTIL